MLYVGGDVSLSSPRSNTDSCVHCHPLWCLFMLITVHTGTKNLGYATRGVPYVSCSRIFQSRIFQSRIFSAPLVLHYFALSLWFCSLSCLWTLFPYHIVFFKHSLVAQAASQWVACFSGSLPIVFILRCSRKINMMMMMMMTTMIGVSGWMFLLVPAHPGCPGQSPESHKRF